MSDASTSKEHSCNCGIGGSTGERHDPDCPRYVSLTSNQYAFAKGVYSAKAVEVLRFVAAGEPYAGRNRAGRSVHLGWLEKKGLVEYSPTGDSNPPFKWVLTEAGRRLLEVENAN